MKARATGSEIVDGRSIWNEYWKEIHRIVRSMDRVSFNLTKDKLCKVRRELLRQDGLVVKRKLPSKASHQKL